MPDIKFYLSILFRRLPYLVIVAVLISAIGISIASVLPPVYRADALLLIESPRISDNLASSTVNTNANEELQIIEQRLMTRANLLDVANRLNIYSDRPDMTPTGIVADMRSRAAIRLRGQRGGALTITVAFEDESGTKAAEVTNEFVTLLLRENVEMRQGLATETVSFFEQEIERLDEELAIQSGRILEFKMANKDSLPDSLDYRRSRQAGLQERLVQLSREAANLQDRRSRLVDLYERTGSVTVSEDRLTPEQRELESLKSELDSALLVYSDQNPKIRILQSRIASLEQVVQRQSGTDDSQDALSEYELQLADIDGELEYINEQKAEIETELEGLRESIEKTPANSIRLAELERDYANTQQLYNQNSSRLAQAQTGAQIELRSKGRRISVIEQATPPAAPTSPNRPLIAAGGVGAGIGLGFGLVALLELLNRSIRRPVELTTKLGITPIATLPYMRTERELRIRKFILGTIFLIAVVGIPVTLWALHTYYLPMDLLIDKFLENTGLRPLLDSLK